MKPLRITAIALLSVCVICLFIALERYNANAQNVHAMSGMIGAFGGQVEPATPAATKYASFFALLSGGGGLFCLLTRRKS
jgi:hypothetical protein